MSNYLFFLQSLSGEEELCAETAPVLRIVGILYRALLIVIPLVLIIIGMTDFVKAVAEKSDDKIKDAQKKFISRLIAAVIAVLIIVLVGLVMRVVGNTSYKACMYCITDPFGSQCTGAVNGVYSEYGVGSR